LAPVLMDNRARGISVSAMKIDAHPALQSAEAARPWWERRWFLAFVVLATMVPLIYPQIPPLVDLPGHIGRYRVEIDGGHSLFLQRYYGFHWAMMGNLGVDVLVLGLAPMVGLELAVKLIVLAIPPLTACGFLWVAREVNGRIPPTACFALPFIYSFPFLFGFVNFALSAGLAFIALALWLRLGTAARMRLRSWLFIPISFVIFFCHAYGLGLLGLMCFSAEIVRAHDRGRGWVRAAVASAAQVAILALPLVLMVLWPSGSPGSATTGWFDWDAKWTGVYGVLRDRWGPFDVASLELTGIVLLFALVSPKLKLAPTLALSGGMLAISFMLLPRFIMGSAYADVRLLPYLIAVLLLGIRLRQPLDLRSGSFLAALALAFFLVRLTTTTISMAIAANDQQAKLGALRVIPRGARVVSFFGLPYAEPWSLQRDSHLGALVIARREGFSNDQWLVNSHNLLQLRYVEAGAFAGNPSQVVRPNGTHDGVYRTIDDALAEVPRDKFDYIWLIDVPPFDHRLLRGLQPVWSGPETTLYRIPPRNRAN
jgi:hypothetical protein